MLDQSSEEGARTQVTRLCEALDAAPVVYDGQAIALSACFGVAMLAKDMTESDILAAADQDMYRCKQRLGAPKIGRASCRERVGQYVSSSVVAVSLNNKKPKK